LNIFLFYVYKSIKTDDNYVEQRKRRKHFIRSHDNLRLLLLFSFHVCVRHRRYVLSFVNKNFLDRLGARDTHELDNLIGNQKSRHTSIDQINLIDIILMNKIQHK
jgi:hypothetical protein